jgi:hypothetical protein
MEQGFVVDTSASMRLVSHWAAGPPRKAFWSGTKEPEGGLVPVGTFRRRSCGYLESYADPEFVAE